eukprot:COSAG06_NODE_67139_length_252_cov_1.496732_1_plen_63_part_01
MAGSRTQPLHIFQVRVKTAVLLYLSAVPRPLFFVLPCPVAVSQATRCYVAFVSAGHQSRGAGQ